MRRGWTTDVHARTWRRRPWTCARTISVLPFWRRYSSSSMHLYGWCSVVLSLSRFHTIVMIAENSTVNVPLATSLRSEALGGFGSLHVHSRTICSISE